MTPALSCRNISVRFGAFVALNDVSLDFEAGRTTALIGPNGAGKTTLLNVLSGLQPVSSGSVALDGADITTLPSFRRARAGLSRSFQLLSIFPEMTVAENIRLALQPRHMAVSGPWRPVGSYRRLRADVDERLEIFGLADSAGTAAGNLSHGRQRALELCLALASEPRVVLLDEPLAGVGHAEAEPFVALLKAICSGRTTILVEHNMDVVMGIAEEIVVLVGGAVLAQGPADRIRADRRVRDAYLGA